MVQWQESVKRSATVCLCVQSCRCVRVCKERERERESKSDREKCVHEGGDSSDSGQTERQFKLLSGSRDAGQLWTSATVLQEIALLNLISFSMSTLMQKYTCTN